MLKSVILRMAFKFYQLFFVRPLMAVFHNTGLVTKWGLRDIHYAIWSRLMPKEPVSLRGMKFHLPPHSAYLSTLICNNQYEEFELEVFSSEIKPGQNILDVGANIGIYTVTAALKTGNTGKVIGVEPEPVNMGILRRNILLNQLPNVVLIEKAASDRTGILPLYKSKELLAHSLSGVESLNDGSVDVEQVLLDFAIGHEIPIHVIKMDVEGWELKAMAGMKRLLNSSDLSRLFIEYCPIHQQRAGAPPDRLPQELERLGFALYHINGNKKSVDKISSERAFERAEKEGLINILAKR